MSDPYADALGILSKPVRPRASDPLAGTGNLSPDEQARSDVQMSSVDQAPTAKDLRLDGIRPDIAAAGRADILRSHRMAVEGAGRAKASSGDPYAAALGIGSAVSPVSSVPPAQVSPQMAAQGGEDPNSNSYRMAHGTGDADPMRLAAHVVSGIGASIYGGYKGLATLVTGGGLDKAVGAINQAQQDYTYQPQQGTQTAQMAEQFDSHSNPLNWPGVASSYAGQKIGDAGYPGIGAAVTAAGTVLGAPLLFKGMTAGRAPLSNLLKGPKEIAPRIEPTMGEPAANAPTIATPSGAAPTIATPSGAIGKVQEAAATPEQMFSDHSATNGATPLNASEQTRRAQVLQSVGLESARKSSLTGNGLEAATDAQTAKVNSPAGAALKAQLDNEKSTLGNYADKLVQDTRGTVAADQGADYTRGANITSALDGIKDWYDGHIKRLYGAADTRAQGAPTSLGSFGEVMNDASHLTNLDRISLKPALESYVKKAGMTVGEDGQISGTVAQAETVRKYLNEQWSPQNSGFVRTLKDSLDDDVTKSAGEDVYGEARKMRSQRAETLDNPNGISDIMDTSGPKRINRLVATEKIPTAIASMPVDQLAHIIETLKNAPDEVQPKAQVALAEIKSHFANQVRQVGSSQAGQYNAKGVGNYLRANAARMGEVFSPEEIAGFKNLHDAGQILAKDQSYPGAAVQSHNLVRAGVMQGVQTGATAIGAGLGGPIGAAMGNFVGGKAAQVIGDRGSLKAAQGRMTKLSDLADVKPDK